MRCFIEQRSEHYAVKDFTEFLGKGNVLGAECFEYKFFICAEIHNNSQTDSIKDLKLIGYGFSSTHDNIETVRSELLM